MGASRRRSTFSIAFACLRSYWMIAAGIVGGLAAAIFGYIDYRAIPVDTRARRVGRIHGMGIALASVCLRRRPPIVRPRAPPDPALTSTSMSAQ
jgi:hypothetical protein